MKKCSKCGETKEFNEFWKNKTSKDGLQQKCKVCKTEYTHAWRKANPDRVNASKRKWVKNTPEKVTAYCEDNQEKLIEFKRKWAEANPEKAADYQRGDCQDNHEKKIDYRHRRYHNNPQVRIVNNLRARVWKVLKGNTKSASTMELLGCNIGELRQHFESQFTEGMNWDNYGSWHIDHIRPCCSFDLSDPKQQRECFNWKNLQPLWAEENLSKSGKYFTEDVDSLNKKLEGVV